MSYDYIYKIIIVGDSNVGKSSLLTKYVDNHFISDHLLTYGIDFKIKTLKIDDKTLKLQLWDTAGQERFRNIVRSYYKNASGVIIVFDLTNIESYNNVSYWCDDVYNYFKSDISIIIIGTKSDLYKNIVVTSDMIDKINKKYKYIEVSSKTGKNIADAFNILAMDILFQKKELSSKLDSTIKLGEVNHSIKKKCC
jgi:Ras-related protein Rab-1A